MKRYNLIQRVDVLLVPPAVVLVHYLLSIFGFPIVSIAEHWQLASEACLLETPLKAFLLTHGASPFLGMIQYVALKIGDGNPDRFYSFFLPFLHIASFFFLRSALGRFRLKFLGLILSVLFLNPLAFLYFRYPFYSTYLFFLTCFQIFVFFSRFSVSKKFLLLSFAISLGSFIRPAWHIGLAVLWIAYMAWNWRNKLSPKIVAIGAAFLLLPLGLYTKNYIYFGSFTGSTWFGMNLARSHMRINVPNTITSVFPFEKLSMYKGLYDENGPLIQKYANEPCLNEENFQNIRYLYISKEYYKQVAPKISGKYTLRVFRYGVGHYLRSPGNYIPLKPLTSKVSGFWKTYPNVDIFAYNLPLDEELTLYQFLYPLVTILFILSFRNLSWKIRLLLLHLGALSFLASLVDPFEANRMRFELEPIWYFFVLLSPYYLNRILKKWKKKRPEKKAA